MKIRSYTVTITVADGTGNGTTALFLPMKNAGGIIGQVILKAPAEDTLYNFYITNPNGRTVYKRNNVTGDYADEVKIPVLGTYTCYITNASADGSFYAEIMLQENE